MIFCVHTNSLSYSVLPVFVNKKYMTVKFYVYHFFLVPPFILVNFLSTNRSEKRILLSQEKKVLELRMPSADNLPRQ